MAKGNGLREEKGECLQRLAESGVVKLMRFPEPVRSVEMASRATGLPPEAIVKTLVWKVEGRLVALIVRGDCRVSPRKLARALGVREAGPASRGEVREATGYPAGGVPPLCLQGVELVVVDRGVLGLEEVVAGGGDEHSLIIVKVRVLLEHNRPLVLDIADCTEK